MSIFQQFFGNSGFDPNSVGASDFDVLPPGQYPVVIETVEVKENSKGTGHLLSVCQTITDGPYRGRKLWSSLNLSNPSETAQKIGWSQVNKLNIACGLGPITNNSDERDLLGKSCIANVKVKDDANEVRSWSKVAACITPTPAQIPKVQEEKVVQPVTASTGTKPPWAR